MEKKYYDTWQFVKAQTFKNTNPVEGIKKFEEYLKEYPNDYSAYGYYASNLINVGRIDEAEKIMQYVEKASINDKKFACNEEYKMEAVKFSIFYNKLRIYSYKGKYKELYELCKSHPKEIRNLNMSDLIFYCKKKLGKIDENRREKNSYLFRQIVEYKEEDFLDHIKKHLADYNSTLDEPNKNIFVPDFPLEDALKEIRKHMPSDKKIYTGFWENTYIFKCNECGRVDNRLVNYIKVVCFHGTSNIITILPVAEGENLPYVDLSYLTERENAKEIKRMSAVEKFNKRFKR